MPNVIFYQPGEAVETNNVTSATTDWGSFSLNPLYNQLVGVELSLPQQQKPQADDPAAWLRQRIRDIEWRA